MGNSNETAENGPPELMLMFPSEVYEKTEILLEKLKTGTAKFIQWMNMNPANYKDLMNYFHT